MLYKSTKTFTHELGWSAAFRQWKANSHCNKLHGYALSVKLVFASPVLDHRNWVVDFGGFKALKQILEDYFDHKTLVSKDDPELQWFMDAHNRKIMDVVVIEGVGCERFAELAFILTKNWMKENGLTHIDLVSAEVSEHGANSAIYENNDLSYL